MSAKNYSGVRKAERAGRTVYCIDFRYTDSSGKKKRYQRDAPVQNAAAAHAEAKRLIARAAQTGSPVEQTKGGITFKEFVEGVYEADYMPTYRPATRARYRALLKQTVAAEFGPMPLSSIGSADYRTFAGGELRRGVNPKGPLNLVRSILRAAEASGLIEVTPALPKGLIRVSKKLPSCPSEAEVQKMLTAAGWVKTAIHLGALAGLRGGEVRALEVQDIDLKNNVLNIRRAISGDASTAPSLTPKSGHERVVPMMPALASHLAITVKGKLPRARVITNSAGLTPRRQELLHVFKVALGKLKTKAWSFHSLRHYFISELVRRGAGLEAVRAMAGHGSLSVTQRYAHATASDAKAAILLLG